MKKTLKKLTPNFIIQTYRIFRYEKLKQLSKFKGKSYETVFNEIYETKYWNSISSVSGSGSDLEITSKIRQEIPKLFKRYGISSVLDIPCGDFYWMKELDLSNIHYIGADIVDGIIKSNSERYGKNNVEFKKIDLLKDDLPTVDLIINRDCLVHFSYNHITQALENIKQSKSRYLLSTTFQERKKNYDIVTGEWRPLNLLLPPFCFPRPIETILENSTEGGGEFHDKALCMWEIEK